VDSERQPRISADECRYGNCDCDSLNRRGRRGREGHPQRTSTAKVFPKASAVAVLRRAPSAASAASAASAVQAVVVSVSVFIRENPRPLFSEQEDLR
jgi:hypothetical protein